MLWKVDAETSSCAKEAEETMLWRLQEGDQQDWGQEESLSQRVCPDLGLPLAPSAATVLSPDSPPWSLKRKTDESWQKTGAQPAYWCEELLCHSSSGLGMCREWMVCEPEERCSEDSWSRTIANKKSKRLIFVIHWHSVELTKTQLWNLGNGAIRRTSLRHRTHRGCC